MLVEHKDKIKTIRPFRKIILWVLGAMFVFGSIATYYVSRHFNQLLADALVKSFESNIISDVYELKFDKLKVNFFQGNIQVLNVVLQRREKQLGEYPYINSSFRLTTGKILLKKVKILTLLESSKLVLSRIVIVNPDIQVSLSGDNNILMPYQDSAVALRQKIKNIKKIKKFVNSYFLENFELVNASFHIINKGKQREFKVQELNISLNNLMIDQLWRKDVLTFKNVELSVGGISGDLPKDAVSFVGIKDYTLTMGELKIQKSIDTLIYSFKDLNTSMKNLNIQTADSIFDISAQSIAVSYRDKSVNLVNLAFKPNIGHASMQKMYKYQTLQISGTINSAKLMNVNFDTLVYYHKIYVDKVELDKVEISVFKDKTKSLDENRVPEYLAQQLTAIPVPMIINQLKATNVNVVSKEIKPDGKHATVNISNGTIEAKNISSLPSDNLLTINATASIENKAQVSVDLFFSYLKPEFNMNGTVGKFNLTDLNPLFQAYSPLNIKKGIADKITFAGTATRTNSKGTMKFLYHDLDVDLQLKDRAKWINSIITFAANAYIDASNPSQAGIPPRTVEFKVDRDMNKGFINIIIRSFLSGLKETMISSKENRQAYKEKKKKWKLGKEEK